MPRFVSETELCEMLAKVLAANPTIADTERNGEIIATEFLENAPPSRSLRNMVDSVNRVAHKLERCAAPKPIPPAWVDDDLTKPLSDGTMPLPINASQLAQRTCSRAQSLNYIDRLRRKTKWEKEHQ